LVDCGFLSDDDLIIGGDLNLTLSSQEVWGKKARIDPLAGFFSQLFTRAGLVDVLPCQLKPTWRNGHLGSEGISKCLDRFLVAENLLEGVCRFRSWVLNANFTDHNPVCLQIVGNVNKHKTPFKFNHAWLLEPDFNFLVRSKWRDMEDWQEPSTMNTLVAKLKGLKEVVIKWKKEKRLKLKVELCDLEQKIEDIYFSCPSQFFSKEDKDLISSYELRRNEILRLEEEAWHLKIRAIWLQSGDKNTNFFHKFVEQRRVINTIWEIKNSEGERKTSQADIEEVALNFFQNLYKVEEKEDIQAQLQVVKEVPRFFLTRKVRS
jgi:hypothetical protein